MAGQMFLQYEKKLNESNQIFKGYQDFIGDDKTKNVALNKVFENYIKKLVNSEKDEVYNNSSINIYIELLNSNKCEVQFEKKQLWISILFH